jgi:hypothetical protein
MPERTVVAEWLGTACSSNRQGSSPAASKPWEPAFYNNRRKIRIRSGKAAWEAACNNRRRKCKESAE